MTTFHSGEIKVLLKLICQSSTFLKVYLVSVIIATFIFLTLSLEIFMPRSLTFVWILFLFWSHPFPSFLLWIPPVWGQPDGSASKGDALGSSPTICMVVEWENRVLQVLNFTSFLWHAPLPHTHEYMHKCNKKEFWVFIFLCF